VLSNRNTSTDNWNKDSMYTYTRLSTRRSDGNKGKEMHYPDVEEYVKNPVI